MKISKRFQDLKEKQPYWSDTIIFNTCITGKSLLRTEISKAFKLLVDKSEYDKSDLDDIIAHSQSLALLKR